MFSQKSFFSIPVLVLIIIILLSFPEKSTNAQTVQRIGVFDSRAVVLAYFNSKFSNIRQIFQSLDSLMQVAKSKDDKTTISKIDREGILRQAMLHNQGFGTGSINTITETIKDKLAKLANDENLSAVVSKWEIAFSNKDVELIDITDKIVNFFEPTEQVKTMAKEIMQAEPVKDAYLIDD